jgi:hypothetical protein
MGTGDGQDVTFCGPSARTRRNAPVAERRRCHAGRCAGNKAGRNHVPAVSSSSYQEATHASGAIARDASEIAAGMHLRTYRVHDGGKEERRPQMSCARRKGQTGRKAVDDGGTGCK